MKPGDIVFLSASVPYRKPWIDGAHPLEIQEAIVSIARAVFSRKGRLLFGGHPSISPLIADIAGEYYAPDPDRAVRPVITFQSKYYEGKLPDQTWLLYRMGWSSIEWTPTVGDDNKSSLREMRESMLLSEKTSKEVIKRNQLQPPVAMFAVGGMEGVRDEALLFLDHRNNWPINRNARVFALTTGGGAAVRLLAPPFEWPTRLWPESAAQPKDVRALSQALERGDVVALEQGWADAHPNALPADVPLQPYAAIVQWVLDEVIHAG